MKNTSPTYTKETFASSRASSPCMRIFTKGSRQNDTTGCSWNPTLRSFWADTRTRTTFEVTKNVIGHMKIHLASEVSGSTESHQENWGGLYAMCVYNHICAWTLDLAKGLQILHLWEDSGIHGELLPRGCQINAIAVEWFLVVPKKQPAFSPELRGNRWKTSRKIVHKYPCYFII